jgi:hypothetical protein
MQPSAVALSPAAPIDEMKRIPLRNGGKWEPVRDANRPRKYFEKMKFIPILDGRFETSQQIIRNQDGKIVYRDSVVFGADPDTHKLFLAAYNTDGSIDRTHQIESQSGQWVFLGTVYGSAQFRDYRYIMTQLDGGHLRIAFKDGKYEKHSDVTYERTSRTNAPQID